MGTNLIETVREAAALADTDIPLPVLLAIISAECGGSGFDSKTGKILIQFEPHLFSRATGLPRGVDNAYSWDENRVDVQSKEWLAFNEAFAKDAVKAMEATSIGMPQILGAHWKRLGYVSVGAMWDAFKKSEAEQLKGLIRFLTTDTTLYVAAKVCDWDTVAKRYNGSKYKALALSLGREPYDVTLAKAYSKYKALT